MFSAPIVTCTMNDPSKDRVARTRDSLLQTQDELIAEHLAQAQQMGELQSAKGYGQPLLELEGYLETPPEFRMPFKILKNAGAPPPEVALFQKRGELQRQLQQTTDAAERKALQQTLSELEQALALRLEGMRVSGKL